MRTGKRARCHGPDQRGPYPSFHDCTLALWRHGEGWISGHDHGGASYHPRLLLADEDQVSCETVARAFARRGFQVEVARGVDAALTLATERSPEYAAVELRLPDGPELDLLEWEYICEVLQERRGNVSQAARALLMHRRTLQRKLSERPAGNRANVTRQVPCAQCLCDNRYRLRSSPEIVDASVSQNPFAWRRPRR